jgi:ATP-dependent DNA helicase PIF1
MIPLKPGYAISIHGSQGGTIDNVIVNLGNREFAAGLTYVAPTRVRKIENLYFDPMPSLSRLRSMAKTKVFAERRKQDEREKASDAQYVAEANKKYENAGNAD